MGQTHSALDPSSSVQSHGACGALSGADGQNWEAQTMASLENGHVMAPALRRARSCSPLCPWDPETIQQGRLWKGT